MNIASLTECFCRGLNSPPTWFRPVLVIPNGGTHRPDMSAVELIEQVKALPARERQKFLLALLSLEEGASVGAPRARKRVNWPDIEARAKRIVGKRVLPNLVLMEREEAGFWVG